MTACGAGQCLTALDATTTVIVRQGVETRGYSSVAEQQPPQRPSEQLPELQRTEMAQSDNNRPPSLSRRRFLAIGGGSAAAAAALYAGLAVIQRQARPTVGPPRGGYPVGQYQIADYGVRVQPDPQSAVDVIIPPVWNVVVTAQLTRAPRRKEQQRLEAALRAVESAYPYSPAGVFALVAYGLPYFRSYVPSPLFDAHLPHMLDTGAPVLLDAIRFDGDPSTILLETNDVVFHLRSDTLDNLRDVQHALFSRSGALAGQPAPAADLSDLFHVTSVRTGFIGRGLPKQMAEQAHLAVAAHIPSEAPLFMGFTSTQRLGQAREEAVAFDQPPDPLEFQPLTTARPGDYFAGATTLHISHLLEDLDAWYALPYEQRSARMFHLNVTAPVGRVTVQTLWLNPNTAPLDAQQQHIVGHNEAVQRSSRTPEGQALQLRVDFNTMDPLDSSVPHPGVHFLAFTPGSQVFHRSRRAMDATDLTGQYALPATSNGINGFIRATRRQNFLVPPRCHRAFPLVELMP